MTYVWSKQIRLVNMQYCINSNSHQSMNCEKWYTKCKLLIWLNRSMWCARLWFFYGVFRIIITGKWFCERHTKRCFLRSSFLEAYQISEYRIPGTYLCELSISVTLRWRRISAQFNIWRHKIRLAFLRNMWFRRLRTNTSFTLCLSQCTYRQIDVLILLCIYYR